MHSEFYSMKEEVADILNEAKRKGKRIVAVGTTTTRTLETIYHEHHTFIETSGWTKIFFIQGFNFKQLMF